MKNFAARLASFLSLTYVPVSISHMIWYVLRTGDLWALKYSLVQPLFWFTIVVSIYIGVRVAARDAVAWWFGLIGAGVLLYFRLGYLSTALKDNMVSFMPMGITLVWLVTFLFCLGFMKIPSLRKVT